ncbi:MAG: hypothetical protein MAG551_01144 [Candidatus Scalindua arabica]|uniref:Uncharacterized protein n=1 Tax=Candidatus Scalindua arabica TaxID=1127984 RepID=A0A942A1Y3_9BACT|nr:hypothetical protein [Candidatus Scalindua arabica]
MRKTMEISKHKLDVAKKILRAKNDTQTVDEALSMVIANKEIEKAIKNLFGSMPNFETK